MPSRIKKFVENFCIMVYKSLKRTRKESTKPHGSCQKNGKSFISHVFSGSTGVFKRIGTNVFSANQKILQTLGYCLDLDVKTLAKTLKRKEIQSNKILTMAASKHHQILFNKTPTAASKDNKKVEWAAMNEKILSDEIRTSPSEKYQTLTTASKNTEIASNETLNEIQNSPPKKCQTLTTASKNNEIAPNETLNEIRTSSSNKYQTLTTASKNNEIASNETLKDNEINKLSETASIPAVKLPPLDESDLRKTIVLDLDETLIYAYDHDPSIRYDFTTESGRTTYYVLKRPRVDQFLNELGQKFELVLFTSSARVYADGIVDKLDRGGNISHRLFRDACTLTDEGFYVKDLRVLGRDLRRVLIVDDNPDAYLFQPENAVGIAGFRDDMKDKELLKAMDVLRLAGDYEDVREAVRNHMLNPVISEMMKEGEDDHFSS